MKRAFNESPSRVVAIVALSVFIAESAAMAVIYSLRPFSSNLIEALFDSTLLLLMLSPILYYFLFRPLLVFIKEQQLYEIIMNNLPLGFLVVDKNGAVVELNDVAEKITGYAKNDLAGKPHVDIFYGAAGKDACPLYRNSLHYHEPAVGVECTIKKKTGEPVVLLITSAPLIDLDGRFLGGVELFRDITASKKLERERKNILSMFAHDMKNPVITAEGFLDRILTGRADKSELREEYLGIIRENLKMLEHLIKDFLEFSRLEGKEYKPLLAGFDIGKEIRKQIADAKIGADKKDIQIAVNLEENIPMINADAVMIKRAITNLIDNAIKYSNPGGTVSVNLFNRDKDILVEVKDAGIGISEEHLPYIFDVFYRVNRDLKGSGLGLYIAKTIVEAHNGTIGLESRPGLGSTFRITLPKL